MLNILAKFVGYYVGIGIEAFIILVAGILLILMLTGVLFGKKRLKQPEQQELLPLNAESLNEEANVRQAEVIEESAVAEAEEEPAPAEPEPEEEPAPKKKGKKKGKSDEELLADDEQPAEYEQHEPEEHADPEVIYVHTEGNNGVVFNESKTITELYEELSNEQKSFFDELREEALTKPDSELSITKNYISVKIGKRNLIKLLIKRGVTVAEFMLENEALKQLKASNKNKKGKSSIKVKPTVVQVEDLPSLKVAVDMINLAYEEMMAD